MPLNELERRYKNAIAEEAYEEANNLKFYSQVASTCVLNNKNIILTLMRNIKRIFKSF